MQHLLKMEVSFDFFPEKSKYKGPSKDSLWLKDLLETLLHKNLTDFRAQFEFIVATKLFTDSLNQRIVDGKLALKYTRSVCSDTATFTVMKKSTKFF